MTDHRFGGAWTERKLECLRKYLEAYRLIFTRNPRARYFRTWYVDAFAGTGSRYIPTDETGLISIFDEDEHDDAEQYQAGSAKIALELSSPFDRYLFIDTNRKRFTELRGAIETEYPQLLERCDFRPGDANAEIQNWCSTRDWRKDRAVVFLDPYGMQVEWKTIECIAQTEGIDLWYLFPLGVGVMRLLTRDGNIKEAWQQRLDSVFGTNSWRERFYRTRTEDGLLGSFEITQRTATETEINKFIHERLQTCFGNKVANGIILRNSKNSPLYLLCFAAGNQKGAGPALSIARSILT
jgi:three-Cys-motif partner protein